MVTGWWDRRAEQEGTLGWSLGRGHYRGDASLGEGSRFGTMDLLGMLMMTVTDQNAAT